MELHGRRPFYLFLISPAAAVGADLLFCGEPLAAPGAGLIPPGAAQRAECVIARMLLAADGTLDHLSYARNIEGGRVHPRGFRLHGHVFFRTGDEAGAEKCQMPAAGAAVYIHPDPVRGDHGEIQTLVLPPELHLLPALGAYHRHIRLYPAHLRMLTGDPLPACRRSGGRPPPSPGRPCRSGGRAPAGAGRRGGRNRRPTGGAFRTGDI